MQYVQLALVALLPVVFSGIFYSLRLNAAFKKISYFRQQLMIGIIFGVLSILGTEFGISMDGYNINVRDAAPICAGLIFGGPAGLIAGIIGGLERFIGVAWGLGAYTQVACMLGTFFAGLISALLHWFILERRRPSWLHGLLIGIVTEVFHMLMVFFTHMSDVEQAYQVVRSCSLPMIIFNSLSVMLACIIVNFLVYRKKGKTEKRIPSVSVSIQRHFLICVTVALCVTNVYSWWVLHYQAMDNAQVTIEMNLDDVMNDIVEASDNNMLSIAREAATIIAAYPKGYYNVVIDYLINNYNLAEVDIIDENGIVAACSNPEYVGYDMRDGEQSAEFMVLLDEDGPEELTQALQPNYFGAIRKYAGHTLEGGGFIQIAYDTAGVHQDISEQVHNISKNRHIMTNGFILIADENNDVISDTTEMISELYQDQVSEMITAVLSQPSGKPITLSFLDEPIIASYQTAEGYNLIGITSEEEAMLSRNISAFINGYMLTIVFTVLYLVIFSVVRRHIVRNVYKVNHSLAEITKGNLDTVVDVRGNAEFASMSNYINSTVDSLKGYIAEAEERMTKDLALAKSIQASVLPSVFPPYPNRKDFDIYARTDPAREVGGDFYDFYLVGENRLAFLIADVSGKGIPAAMFMMTAKTILSNYTESGLPVNEVFTRGNAKLCENNEAEMFVTSWMGILDLKTGHVEFANAGHNPPLIHRADGSWEYLKSRAGFVLAGLEDMVYRKQELDLHPGDTIFLYTDGVTEAINTKKELYGEDRLLERLNHAEAREIRHTRAVCDYVRDDLNRFVGEADQFDDITMLAVKYIGQ